MVEKFVVDARLLAHVQSVEVQVHALALALDPCYDKPGVEKLSVLVMDLSRLAHRLHTACDDLSESIEEWKEEQAEVARIAQQAPSSLSDFDATVS